MAQINAYLTFNGRCKEAMTFYKECLGGELTLQTVKDSPMANQWPAHVQDHILHATLINGTLTLLGSDMAAEEPRKGNLITLSLTCDSLEETKLFFDRLSSNGEIVRPLHEFFAGTMGVLNDRFGIGWMFFCDKK